MSNVMGIYVKFTMTTHQIWSCHVTLASNSEIFYFSPNSILNFKKSDQICGIGLRTKRYRQKTNWGWKHPPVLVGLKSCKGINSFDYFVFSSIWLVTIGNQALLVNFVSNYGKRSKLNRKVVCYCDITFAHHN